MNEKEKHSNNLSNLIRKYKEHHNEKMLLQKQIRKTIKDEEDILGRITHIFVDIDDICIDIDTTNEYLTLEELLLFLKDNKIKEENVKLDSINSGELRIKIILR